MALTVRLESERKPARSALRLSGAALATPGKVDVTAVAAQVAAQASQIQNLEAGKLAVVSTGGTDLNGWKKYSDGTIKQWGVVSVASGVVAGSVFSFNTPFLTAVHSLGFTPNQRGRGAGAEANNTARPESLSQFRVASGQGATPLNFNWWAEGI